jgi:hypothetical protein
MSQIACERHFLVPMRWRPAGGDVSRLNLADKRTDRPFTLSTRPPGGPLHASGSLATPIQPAFRHVPPASMIGAKIKSP